MGVPVRSTPSTPASVPHLGSRDPIKQLAVGWGIRWFGISAYSSFLLIYLNANLGVPYALAGTFLTIPNLAGLFFPLIGGGLADRLGRRPILVISFAVESGGIALLAAGMYVGALGVVLVAIFLSRAAATSGAPSVSAYIADFTDVGTRAEAQAWMRTSLNLGFSAGALAGGALLTILTFGQVVALAAVVTAIGVLQTVVLVPPTPYDTQLVAARVPRSIESAHSEAPPTAPPTGRVERMLLDPLAALWRDRSLLLVWASACSIWTLNLQLGYAVPAFAHSSLGVSFTVIGIALALNAAIIVGIQVPFTRGLAGHSMTTIGVAGVGAYAIAFVGLGLEGVTRLEVVPVLLVLIVVLTLGETAVFLPVSTLSMNIAPRELRGAYSGAMNMSAGVGTIFAPLFAGLVLGLPTNPLAAWALLALPAVPAATLLLLLKRRLPKASDTC